ncbi:MAG TPA: FRG domain-containing protein [Clostridia bacterium]|nr:FRG domain-containing protein [Clostridia bacterium]
MIEIPVKSTEDLIRQLNELPNNFIYRGEADATRPLQSSLERVIGNAWSEANAERFENFSFDQFKSKFHLYDRENVCPSSKLAWLSIMQHYGVPTRLLDFTESPYVALYFALESYDPQKANAFAVYALDYSTVMEQSIDFIKARDPKFNGDRQTVYQKQDEVFESVIDPANYDIVWVTEPKQVNTRLDRQAGCFLLSGNKAKKLADVLNSDTYKTCDYRKFIIHQDLYEGVFVLLRKMNINSKSIYGDLNGLARTIKMQMQIYSVQRRTASGAPQSIS